MNRILLCLLVAGCMPDLAGLSEGVPAMGCEWSPNEGATTTVPEGECWRVRALAFDTRVQLEGESCGEAWTCLVAVGGETVVPLTALGADVRDEDFETVAWDCEALASACEEGQ